MNKHSYICRCDGMVDVTDSKSVGGNIVWVRVPPPAPEKAAGRLLFSMKSTLRVGEILLRNAKSADADEIACGRWVDFISPGCAADGFHRSGARISR